VRVRTDGYTDLSCVADNDDDDDDDDNDSCTAKVYVVRCLLQHTTE